MPGAAGGNPEGMDGAGGSSGFVFGSTAVDLAVSCSDTAGLLTGGIDCDGGFDGCWCVNELPGC